MKGNLHVIVKIALALIAVIVVLIIGHEQIESHFFKKLANQQGMNMSFNSRSGSLFTGYELKGVSIKSSGTGNDNPPWNFSTPMLAIRWHLLPDELTAIEWDQGSIETSSGESADVIIIGEGHLLPDADGALTTESPVQIGDPDWDGSMSLAISADLKNVSGEMLIEHLPAKHLQVFCSVPSDFNVAGNVKIELELSGSPGRINASGTVSNPLSWQSYKF